MQQEYIHSLVGRGLEDEPDAGGHRRRQHDPDRVEAGGARRGAGRVERALRLRLMSKREKKRLLLVLLRGAPRRHLPWRAGARPTVGYLHRRLRNAGPRKGPRRHGHVQGREHEHLLARPAVRRGEEVGFCSGSRSSSARAEAETEPIPAAAAAAAVAAAVSSAAAPAGARGLRRRQHSWLLVLFLLGRNLVLLRLWAFLVYGLLGHVVRLRRHSVHAAGDEGRRAMLVPEQLQVPSRDHPGRRRFMPSARPARPGPALARQPSYATIPPNKRSIETRHVRSSATGDRSEEEDDQDQEEDSQIECIRWAREEK